MKLKLLPFLLLFSGFVFAANVQDLNKEIYNVDTTVAETTTTVDAQIAILRQTNHFETTLLVAPILAVAKGASVDIPLTLIPGPTPIAALQFNIAVPTGISISSVTPGDAALAANKSVDFSTGPATAIIFGLNQTPIDNGIVAVVHLKVSSAQATGFYSFEMNSPSAADATGIQIPLSLTSGILEVQ